MTTTARHTNFICLVLGMWLGYGAAELIETPRRLGLWIAVILTVGCLLWTIHAAPEDNAAPR